MSVERIEYAAHAVGVAARGTDVMVWVVVEWTHAFGLADEHLLSNILLLLPGIACVGSVAIGGVAVCEFNVVVLILVGEKQIAFFTCRAIEGNMRV